MNVTLKNSPFEKRSFKGVEFYLKRDDLLDADFSGNKARKFYAFLQAPLLHVTRLVSYGSNQSNAMYSMSVLAKIRGWEFHYFCSHLPKYLQENPIGNYKAALDNGMCLHLSDNYDEEAKTFCDENTLFIQEGGRQKESEIGIEILAQELRDDIEQNRLKDPFVFLPSGTGTTALYLQKYLPFPVYTCSTVGDDNYLVKQWQDLGEDAKYFPKILKSNKKFHYGKLYLELYKVWEEVTKESGVVFDLVYDPIGWKNLMKNWHNLEGNLIYIHQGGLKGNESMLERYTYKYDIIV